MVLNLIKREDTNRTALYPTQFLFKPTVITVQSSFSSDFLFSLHRGKAIMKAFIVLSVTFAIIASCGAVDNSQKEKRGLWEESYENHEQRHYNPYEDDNSQLHHFSTHQYKEYEHDNKNQYYQHQDLSNQWEAKKEIKHIITKKVPVPYPVEVEKRIPVEVKVPYPVETEKKVPVVVEKKVPVYVEKKYPVHVDRPVPYPVKVEVPVYKKEYVEVPKPYAVHVEKPYPVYVDKKIYVEKPVPVTVYIKKHEKKPFWVITVQSSFSSDFLFNLHRGKANMKAFIVLSVALAIIASCGAVDNSQKEKRGIWEESYENHEQRHYNPYEDDNSQLHHFSTHQYKEYEHDNQNQYYQHQDLSNQWETKKEFKHIITKKVPVPYPVEVEKRIPVEVKVPYPVETEKKVPVVVEKKVPVYVEKKYPVHVDRPVPYPVKVEVPVYKKEYVEVPKPYAVHVEKPYPVYVDKKIYVEKPVPVTVYIKKHEKKPFWG
ncbi:titin-like [Uranotaenia lowii]|uniref:titin-like n=1 Tax=Uranotaenia lowii TaxID=190385 RepID=UPI002478A93A|nr:titin-like [Uranotaenia lowii]